jgi:hypothetical protein
MLENRGQLGRRLVQLRSAGEAQVEPGGLLFDVEGKRVGELTSVARVTDAAGPATLALGYVKRPVCQPGHTVRSGERAWFVETIVGEASAQSPIVAP